MSLNLVQCRKFKDETCDDICSMQIFNWRTREDELFCMWGVLAECDNYRGSQTANKYKESERGKGE